MAYEKKYCTNCKWIYFPSFKEGTFDLGPFCFSPDRQRDLVTGEYKTISCRLARTKIEDFNDDNRCTPLGLWYEEKGK
jgi:hypothetical protein